MVANLVKSKLVELPSMPPPSATETPDGSNTRINHHNDPWRNVFPKPRQSGFHHHHQPQFYPPPPENNEGQDGWNVDDMGMYDAEDGGIYRCLDCMHEIWGGVCTNCHREYPGHARFDEDDDDDDEDVDEFGDDGAHNFLGRRLRQIWQGYNGIDWDPEDDDEEEDDDDDDEEDVDMGEFYEAHGDPMELTDESGSEEGTDQEEPYTDEEHSGDEWSTDGEGDDHGHQRGGYYHHLPNFPAIDMLHGLPFWPVHGRRHRGIEPVPAAHIEEMDEDEEEDEEEFHSEPDSDQSHPSSDDHEGSFIDDGEDDDDDQGHHHRRNPGRNRRHQGGDVVEIVDSDDDGQGHGRVDHRAIARQLGRGMRLGGGRGAGGDDEPRLPTPPPRRTRSQTNRNSGRRGSPILVDGEEEDEEDDYSVGPSIPLRRGRPQVLNISDEEESEDEAPRRVSRSGRRRAPAVDDEESE